MATPNISPPQEPERAVYPVFQAELLKALIDNMHKQNTILTNLNDVLLDLRDELALARTERKKTP